MAEKREGLCRGSNVPGPSRSLLCSAWPFAVSRAPGQGMKRVGEKPGRPDPREPPQGHRGQGSWCAELEASEEQVSPFHRPWRRSLGGVAGGGGLLLPSFLETQSRVPPRPQLSVGAWARRALKVPGHPTFLPTYPFLLPRGRPRALWEPEQWVESCASAEGLPGGGFRSVLSRRLLCCHLHSPQGSHGAAERLHAPELTGLQPPFTRASPRTWAKVRGGFSPILFLLLVRPGQALSGCQS